MNPARGASLTLITASNPRWIYQLANFNAKGPRDDASSPAVIDLVGDDGEATAPSASTASAAAAAAAPPRRRRRGPEAAREIAAAENVEDFGRVHVISRDAARPLAPLAWSARRDWLDARAVKSCRQVCAPTTPGALVVADERFIGGSSVPASTLLRAEDVGYATMHLHPDAALVRRARSGSLPPNLTPAAKRDAIVFLSGSNRTQSTSHADDTNSLLVVVGGAKRVKYVPRGHAVYGSPDALRRETAVDPFAVHAPNWLEVALLAGDALYLPRHVLHCVQSTPHTVAVSVDIAGTEYGAPKRYERDGYGDRNLKKRPHARTPPPAKAKRPRAPSPPRSTEPAAIAPAAAGASPTVRRSPRTATGFVCGNCGISRELLYIRAAADANMHPLPLRCSTCFDARYPRAEKRDGITALDWHRSQIAVESGEEYDDQVDDLATAL